MRAAIRLAATLLAASVWSDKAYNAEVDAAWDAYDADVAEKIAAMSDDEIKKSTGRILDGMMDQLSAIQSVISQSRHQMGVRGVTHDQVQCLAENVAALREQRARLLVPEIASATRNYLTQLWHDEPEYARELSEYIAFEAASVEGRTQGELFKLQRCLFGYLD